MQPPPRKGNYLKFLKSLHAEQITKLQLKNQHECDLLEDIRQFTIKRSAIEKQYSESLLKISSAYLNKKIPNIPDIKMEGQVEERWNMWSVWQTVLEENEKLARARLAAIEVFQQQIADEAKVLREYKLQIAKKCLSQIANIQKELHFSVADVDRTKKQYFDEEHCAHDVRDKARDIEEKLKKKKGSFFQSITSLQKNSARVTSRKEMLEEKSTGARNDYILTLAAANAHQNRYFTVDLQTTMTTMENYVYERVAEYLTLMGRTELLTCSATQNSFGKIRDQAQQLTREYNLQCCYLFYPVLKQHIQYDFEPCDNDPISKITAEHESAAETLAKEAKNLAAKVVQANNTIRESAKKLAVCSSLRDAGQRSDPNDPNGPDLSTKIEDFKESIRRFETEKCKAEACLECLRAGGINVDEWVKEAESLEAQELTRSASSLSMRTDASEKEQGASSDSFYDSDKDEDVTRQDSFKKQTIAESSAPPRARTPDSDSDIEPDTPAPVIESFATNWDADPTEVNWGASETTEAAEPEIAQPVSATPVPESSQKDVIYKCLALYSYTAQNPDELTIVENEQLEVIGEGDGDGWLRARNYKGEEGYVPHNYLDIDQDTAAAVNNSSQLQTQISFSSVDYTVDNEDQTQDSGQSPDQVSVIMAPGAEQAAAMINQQIQQQQQQIEKQQYEQQHQENYQKRERPKPGEQEYCIAMYDYDATAEDELTFEEGQIIKIITKSAHGVDDGWWEGELNGQVGNFPSLVVEECDENGEPFTYGEDDEEEEDETPPGSAMPSFSFPAAPELPPEYAQNDDLFQSTDEMDDSAMVIDDYPTRPPPMGAPPPPPPVIIEEEPEENSNIPGVRVTNSNGGDPSGNYNLGAVQINVTAATPMIEDKGFIPKDEQKSIKDDKNSSNNNERINNNEADEHLLDDDMRDDSEFDSENEQQHDNVKPIQETEEPFGPKITDKQQQQNNNDNQFETNFEANFEANFDDAFNAANEQKTSDDDDDNSHNQSPQNVVDTPKQVVGGRASIPEELEPHQLARLQNLKESNA
ncbi:protein nervous wreck isoform X2 [Condylostylus longicornis]|uniref:protein nervous wreck isoform X2 n=1 Tax=Condylostylus longicornis TaxID=2530218 RepID=UPI00244D9AEC|nr:protein nervous wreck isoform X2 [Condylostylus longicornis]